MFFGNQVKIKKNSKAGCELCDHFNNDPLMLEELFKGINILSSVHGDSRGDAGICALHDRYLLPGHSSCPDFLQKKAS